MSAERLNQMITNKLKCLGFIGSFIDLGKIIEDKKKEVKSLETKETEVRIRIVLKEFKIEKKEELEWKVRLLMPKKRDVLKM